MDNFDAEVLKVAIKDIFTNKCTFYISDLKHCFELVGIDMPSDLRRSLAPLHCIKYADMPKGMKEEMITRTLQTLQDSGVTRSEVFEAVDRILENGVVRPERTGLLKLVKGA